MKTLIILLTLLIAATHAVPMSSSYGGGRKSSLEEASRDKEVYEDSDLVEGATEFAGDFKTYVAIDSAKRGFGEPDKVWKYYNKGEKLERLIAKCHEQLQRMHAKQQDYAYAKELVDKYLGSDTCYALSSPLRYLHKAAVEHLVKLEEHYTATGERADTQLIESDEEWAET